MGPSSAAFSAAAKERPLAQVAGAGAGTAGAAYTGNKEITLPAESMLSFKLSEPVTVKM